MAKFNALATKDGRIYEVVFDIKGKMTMNVHLLVRTNKTKFPRGQKVHATVILDPENGFMVDNDFSMDNFLILSLPWKIDSEFAGEIIGYSSKEIQCPTKKLFPDMPGSKLETVKND